MPSLKAIRRRIASVKSTQKITRAMKLVAAARLRKAQQRAQDLRPYARKVSDVLSSVSARASEGSDDEHPLLGEHETKKTAVVLVLTSDRGLAGAYNSNVQRTTDRRLRELSEEGFASTQVATIGRKGRDYFRRRGVESIHHFAGAHEGGAARAARRSRGSSSTTIRTARSIAWMNVRTPNSKSAMTQRAVSEQLLPVKPVGAPAAGGRELLFEPDRTALLDRLLPMFVEVMLYRALLESRSIRARRTEMTAMESATKNAKDMIGRLTLQYNRARQAAITKELMEIIGGAEALEG